MMVNSPLEIYSVVIGVRFYDVLFNIFYSFGILYIPLIVLFFQSITPFFSMEDSEAQIRSRKTAVYQVSLFVFSLGIFVAPTRALDVTSIQYKPQCSINAIPSSFGDTGTTYDQVFENLEYQDLKWPLGLAFAMTVVSGVTNAAIVSLPCKTDVQAIKNTITTTKITPEVHRQVSRFANECYAPARSKFDNQAPRRSEYRTLMKNYGGSSDLAWVGSHVFQKLYYGDIYPKGPVPGFSSSQFPGVYNTNNKKSIANTAGFPNCNEWWNDSENGIKSNLLALVDKHQPNDPHLGEVSIRTKLASKLQNLKNKLHIGSMVDAGDVIAHSLLYDIAADGGFSRFNTGWMQTTTKRNVIDRAVKEAAAQAGAFVDRGVAEIKRAEIDEEIPIVQAIMLALILMLGPIILVMGAYRLNVVFTYYFIVSSIISITFIEKFLYYLELSLHDSQSYGMQAFLGYQILFNVFTKLYFIAPLLYLTLMTLCGVRLGDSISHVMSHSISGGSSSKLLGGAGSKAIKAASRGVV